MKSYAEAVAIVEGREYIPETELDDVNKHLPSRLRSECRALLKELDLPLSTTFERAKEIKKERARTKSKHEAGIYWRKRIDKERSRKAAAAERAARKSDKQEKERLKAIEIYGLSLDTSWSEAMMIRRRILDEKKLEALHRKEEKELEDKRRDDEAERLSIIKTYRLSVETSLSEARDIRWRAMEQARQDQELASKKIRERWDRTRLGIGEEADLQLARKLQTALTEKLNSCFGYLYLKTWVITHGGERWYKIGITNNPRRREAEQNVLPVPAETLCLLRFASMEHARAAEKAVLKTLDQQRIRDSNNKELFRLEATAVTSLIATLRNITSHAELVVVHPSLA